jgi:hypothetical protein
MLSVTSACAHSPRATHSQVEGREEYQGYTTYRWPTPDEISPKDLKGLEREVREYSELVGTCLLEEAKGASENDFLRVRNQRFDRTKKAARTGGAAALCGAVRENYVENKLNIGTGADRSTFCQYGNCGEGAEVFACLAFEFGFQPTDIRICLSTNDHTFAMVRPHANQAWCLMDRWKWIDYFHCPADVDRSLRELVTDNGTRYTGEHADWYQKVTCFNFENYVRMLAGKAYVMD